MSKVRHLNPVTDLHAQMLGEPTNEISWAMVLYRGRVVHYVPEYGDGEGRRQCQDMVDECLSDGLAKKEEVEIRIYTQPAPGRIERRDDELPMRLFCAHTSHQMGLSFRTVYQRNKGQELGPYWHWLADVVQNHMANIMIDIVEGGQS